MPDLSIWFFDVGIGDCSLFSSGEKNVLIDGGSWHSDSLKTVLRERNIDRLDCVVCTHLHGDHIDGLVKIVSSYECESIICNAEGSELANSDSYKSLVRIAQKKRINIYPVKERESIEFGSCSISFYNTKYRGLIDENDRSLVCVLKCNNQFVLMPGDVSDDVLKRLVENGVDLSASVLHVPHHGMIDLSYEMLCHIGAKYAVVTYGKNRHGILSKNLFRQLNELETQVFRTDLCGDIYFEMKGDEYSIRNSIDDLDLSGKRLLILGANYESINHVLEAKKKGIFVGVTDNNPNSPAKCIADKAYDVDGTDEKSIAEIIDRDEYDGVLVGVADPLLSTYLVLGENNGIPVLPAFKFDEYSNFFTDKHRFKLICSEVGLCTIPEYYYGNVFEDICVDDISFPCIVKPAVGRNGKGITLCREEGELSRAFQAAIDMSDNGKVCVEKYFSCMDVCAYYFFSDGIPYLLSVTDREVLNRSGEISPVTYGNVYPSSVTEEYKRKCHPKFVNIFRKLQIRNGAFAVQMFWDGDDFYPYDPSGILGAEMTSPIFSKVLGINLIHHFIAYALTGNMQCNSVPCEGGIIPKNRVAKTIWILLKPGCIHKVEGMDGLDNVKGVLGYLWRLHEGDTVEEQYYQTERSVLARIWIYGESRGELKKLEDRLRDRISVFDDDGKNMVLDIRGLKND